MRFHSLARIVCALVIVFGLAASAAAETRPGAVATNRQERISKKKWVLSAVVLVAATFADGYSSRNRIEANPLLRGRDGRYSPAKGIAIKSAITGGLLGVQAFMARDNPRALDKAAYVNFVSAGAFAAMAARNSAVPKAE